MFAARDSANPYLLHMADGPHSVIDITDDDGFEHEFALVPGPDGTLQEHNILYSPATLPALPPYVPPPRRPMTPRPGTPTLAAPVRPTPTRSSPWADWLSAPRGVAPRCAAHRDCATHTTVRCDRCGRPACREHCALELIDHRLRQFVCAVCRLH